MFPGVPLRDAFLGTVVLATVLQESGLPGTDVRHLRRRLIMYRFSSEDPRAPYTVFQGEEESGTYNTRAEARRRQQQLESELPGGTGICIRDIDSKVVI